MHFSGNGALWSSFAEIQMANRQSQPISEMRLWRRALSVSQGVHCRRFPDRKQPALLHRKVAGLFPSIRYNRNRERKRTSHQRGGFFLCRSALLVGEEQKSGSRKNVPVADLHRYDSLNRCFLAAKSLCWTFLHLSPLLGRF